MHRDVGSERFVRIFTGSGCGQKTFKFFIMLDLLIDIVVFIVEIVFVINVVKVIEGARNRAIERKIKENA